MMNSLPDWLRPPPVKEIRPWSLPELASTDTEETAHQAAIQRSAVEEAYQRGWQEGQAALLATTESRSAAMASALAAAEQAMNEAATVLRHQLVATVHALSVAIARHLLEWEISQDPVHIRQLVSRAIAMAPVNGPVTVRLNPDDFAMLQAQDGMPGLPSAEGLELQWTPDSEIGRGGCVLEGPASIVDGRIDRALLDIYERLGHD